MNEIEIRRSTLTDVDTSQRIVEMIAVPWEQETEVMWRGEIWNEVFDRGSFTGIEDHAGRVRINREHMYGDTVGKVIHFDPGHDDGLYTRAKIVNSPRGDETLALAAEDMISPSVGFYVKTRQDIDINKRTKVRRILRAFLEHLAMVEQPAYAGAHVVAVRAEPSGLAVVEQKLPRTPLIDEMKNDPVLQWAQSRLAAPGVRE